MIINFIIVAILLTIDQVTKYYAVISLQNKMPIPLIQDVLHLQYLENRGSAFGMLQDQKLFILFAGLLLVAGIFWFMLKLPEYKKFRKLQIFLAILLSGGIGNIVDRVRLDYVIDFIYFVIIDFPIFNFADICITLSLIIISVLILFKYEESDFTFMSFKQRKIREVK